MKILRFKELKKIIPISRSSIDRWEKSGLFPGRIRLGLNSIGWLEDDIKIWLTKRERKFKEEVNND